MRAAEPSVRDLTPPGTPDAQPLAVRVDPSWTVEDLAAVFDGMPTLVFIAHDPQCRQITGNRAASGVLRLRGGDNLSQTPGGLSAAAIRHFDTEGRELTGEELPMQVAARTGQAVGPTELRLLLPGGREIWISGGAMPLFDPSGHVRGAIAAFTDVTAQKRADAQTQADLDAVNALHALGVVCSQADRDLDACLLEIVDTAIRLSRADKGNLQLIDARTGDLIIAAQRCFSEAFVHYFARVRGAESACGVALGSAQQVVVDNVAASAVFAGQRSLAVMLAEQIGAVQSTPLISSRGAVVGMVSTHRTRPGAFTERELRLMELLARQAADYLERVEQQRRLDGHVEEIEALNARLRRMMTETHHRVKNNLQVISALVDLQVISGEAAVPTSELVRIGHHIRSLAAIHDLLTEQSRDGESVDALLAPDLVDKLSPLLRAVARGREVRYDIANVSLALRQGTSLAVLINELVSNAIKHGDGQVVVELDAADDRARLAVSDGGSGFASDFDPRRIKSTGLELIESVGRHDLMGTITYGNGPTGGARVVVEFPRNPSRTGRGVDATAQR